MDALLEDWAGYARTQLPAARGLDERELRDSAAELLLAIADDMESNQSASQQRTKSQGLTPSNAPAISKASRQHAALRLDQGFTLDQMASEYRALRACVLRHWQADVAKGLSGIDEVIRFSEAMDQSWFEATAWYGSQIAHSRELFLGVLGHDLRSPLSAMTMGAELLLRDTSMSVVSAKTAVRMFNSGMRMVRMMEDLLDFTRVRLGTTLTTDPARCNIGPLLRQTIEELTAAHPDREIQYDSDGELTGTWDGNRLIQMFSNLIGNAVQHGEEGKPVVVFADGRTAEQAVVTVHNDGPPIRADMIDKIFDPLMRGVVQEAERRSRRESLGLGLYIAKEIAKAHEGEIKAVSTLAKGTTFTVTLPRRAERHRSAKAAPAKALPDSPT